MRRGDDDPGVTMRLWRDTLVLNPTDEGGE